VAYAKTENESDETAEYGKIILNLPAILLQILNMLLPLTLGSEVLTVKFPI
jgi:hypothetical protein